MAVKMKPIEPTVVKDPKIIREIITQIRRKPTAEDRKWAKSLTKTFNIILCANE